MKLLQQSIETFRKVYVLDIFGDGTRKQRSYFLWSKPCYAATNLSDQKIKLAMLFGKFYEIINIRLDGFNTSLHGRKCVSCSFCSVNMFIYSLNKSSNKTSLWTMPECEPWDTPKVVTKVCTNDFLL